MVSNFNKACKELYICLKNIDKELYELLPNDQNKKIYEQTLLDETKNIIGYIYYNYWANEQEKQEFKNAVINNSKV